MEIILLISLVFLVVIGLMAMGDLTGNGGGE